jgi:hypothetical protein
MRIQSVSAEGTVTEFPSIQAAGRQGFSVQRVHACVHGKARSHKSLTWRGVGGVFSLPEFISARAPSVRGKYVAAETLIAAFLDWLPEPERDADRKAILTAMRDQLGHYDENAGVFFYRELLAVSPFTV